MWINDAYRAAQNSLNRRLWQFGNGALSAY
jgi:hypothetical protein